MKSAGGRDEIIPNAFGAGLTGIFRDAQEENITIYREEDVEPLIERNKALRNGFRSRNARWTQEAMNWVASIPPTVYLMLMRTGLLYDKTAFDKWLDDPDNAAWRTRPGNLSK